MQPLNKLMDNAELDREKWLALRKHHITATDWPKILGISKYGTAADVLLDKQGLAPAIEETPAMKLGKVIEPFILKALEPTLPQGEIETNPFYARGYCGVTPDILAIRPEDQPLVLLELKSTGHRWTKVPEHNRAQVEFQLATMGITEGQIVCWPYKGEPQDILDYLAENPSELIPFESLEFYPISITPERGEEIRAAADAWFEAHVLFNEPLPTTKVEKPSWKGIEIDPMLAQTYRDAAAQVEAKKAELAQLEANLIEARTQVEARLTPMNALALQGLGFAIERTFRAGAKKVAYDKAIEVVKPTLTPEQTKALEDALAAQTTYNKPSYGLKITEAL